MKVAVINRMDNTALLQFYIEDYFRLGGSWTQGYFPKENRIKCPPLFFEHNQDPSDGMLDCIRVRIHGNLQGELFIGLYFCWHLNLRGVALTLAEKQRVSRESTLKIASWHALLISPMIAMCRTGSGRWPRNSPG